MDVCVEAMNLNELFFLIDERFQIIPNFLFFLSFFNHPHFQSFEFWGCGCIFFADATQMRIFDMPPHTGKSFQILLNQTEIRLYLSFSD